MKASTDTWWVYMLICRDGRIYTGVSNDVVARYLTHLRGKGATFTRLNPPERLIAAAPIGTKAEAMKGEYALKQQRRAEKIAWAALHQWRDAQPQPSARAAVLNHPNQPLVIR